MSRNSTKTLAPEHRISHDGQGLPGTAGDEQIWVLLGFRQLPAVIQDVSLRLCEQLRGDREHAPARLGQRLLPSRIVRTVRAPVDRDFFAGDDDVIIAHAERFPES